MRQDQIPSEVRQDAKLTHSNAVYEMIFVQIEQEYCQGYMKTDEHGIKTVEFPTYKELAEKYKEYGITNSKLTKIGARNRWGVQRALFKKQFTKDLKTEGYRAALSERSTIEGKTVTQLTKLDKILDFYLNRYHQITDISLEFMDQEEIEILRDEVPEINLTQMEKLMNILEKKARVTKQILENADNTIEKMSEEYLREKEEVRGSGHAAAKERWKNKKEIKKQVQVLDLVAEKERKKKELKRRLEEYEKRIKDEGIKHGGTLKRDSIK